ncbi:MAG TPA: IgGFc-binding protein, partial [Prolixibacteraceae bacterium]|nr:IgGFc-binding protein [Prolixibacteraceae bacterium]
MVKYGLILIFALFFFPRLSAQSQPDNCIKSTEGKEFWFGFMENRITNNPFYPPNYLEITITSRFTCEYTITVGKLAVPVAAGTLQPNVPKKIPINRLLAEPYGSEYIEGKALHLVSDQPLNLYAMNWSYNSSDAAVIFPVDALGNEYFAMCYEPNVSELPSGAPWNGKNSEFVVVASEDQTEVTITPSVVTDKLKPAKVPFTITLNKGELYQVQSMNHPNLPGQGDLTGSFIKSDKPVALYSGSWATTVPKSSTYAWDHLYEQIPPLRSWGRKFVSVPLLSRAKDTYRILASVDHTTIRISGKPVVVLNSGEFHEFMLNEDEPALINTDYPVLLAQYSNSNDVDRPASIPQGGPWDGDPSMLIISPVDQTREQVTFVAYDTPEIIQKFFVNIVTKDNSVDQIQLDGQPIAFQVLPNSGYSYAQVSITQGNHSLNSTEAGKGFVAYVYGFGGVESYGYGVGFNLSTTLDLGGDIHFVKDTIVLCNGENKILDAGSHFASFLWNTGETTQKISISKKGYYEVTASTSDGCVLTDGVHAIESNPVVRLGNDTTICNAGYLQLDAGDFSSFLWSTQDTT